MELQAIVIKRVSTFYYPISNHIKSWKIIGSLKNTNE